MKSVLPVLLVFFCINANAQWQQLNTDTLHYYFDTYFINKDTGFICGWDIYSPANDGIILRTKDGGNTWDTTRTSIGFFLTEIQFVNDSTGYTGGQDGNLFMTTNTGDTWNIITNCSMTDFCNMIWLNYDTALILGTNGFMFQYELNQPFPCSILQQTYAASSYPGSGDFEFIDSTNAYLAGYWGGNFSTSSDRGKSWTSFNCCPQSMYALCAKMHDVNNGMIGGNSGQITRTGDGGLTWTQIDTLSRHHLMDFGFYNSQSGYCVGGIDRWLTVPHGDPSGIIWSTTDGGINWVMIDSSFSDKLTDVHIVNDSLAFAVGFYGQVYRNTSHYQNLNSIHENISNDFSIYPNPADAALNIEFRNLVKKGWIEIYNLSGQVVKTERIVSERKKIVYTENLSAGLYVIHLQDGKNSFTRKVILQ